MRFMRLMILATGLSLGLASLNAAEQKKQVPDLPQAVSSFGAVTADGFVYIYGGHAGKTHSYSSETTLGKFYRVSIAKPESGWEELPGGTHLQGLALVDHAGKIIRIGGMEPKNKAGEKADLVSVSTVQAYDPKSKKWTGLTPMPEGRSSHDAVVVNDTLFVVGGWNMKGAGESSTWHDTALSLDLKKADAKWEVLKQPFSRRALVAAAHDGKVFVIAGMDKESETSHDVNIYNVKTGEWSIGTKLPGARMNGFSPAACVLNDTVYISPADGKLYRLDGDKVVEVSALKTARFVHRMVAIGDNRILVLGGASKGGTVAECEVIGMK